MIKIYFKGEYHDISENPGIIYDMLGFLQGLSADLAKREGELIKGKKDLEDARAWVKNYETRILAEVTAEKLDGKDGLFPKYTNDTQRRAAAMARLDTDQEWRERLQICGELDDNITQMTIEYDQKLRDYKTWKLYFQWATSTTYRED